MVDAARDAGVKFDEEASIVREASSSGTVNWKAAAGSRQNPAFANSRDGSPGYKQLNANDAEVLAIVKDGAGAIRETGDQVEVLDHTSFYGTQADSWRPGWFTSTDGNPAVAEIRDAFCRCRVCARTRPCSNGRWPWAITSIRLSTRARDSIGATIRVRICHAAALPPVLGPHRPAPLSIHTRFDFSHFTQVADEIAGIESIVSRGAPTPKSRR
jgi:hypothetical protein